MKIQYSLALIIVGLLLQSCSTSIKQIGTVNMISARNVSPDLKYEMISTYSGGSKKEMKRSRAETIQDALNLTVRKIPGGEFLMNAKVFMVDERYFVVEGDVWGKPGVESYRGFTVGDRVVCKDKKLLRSLDLKNDIVFGKVVGLIDDKTVYVQLENVDRIIELPYDRITKSLAGSSGN